MVVEKDRGIDPQILDALPKPGYRVRKGAAFFRIGVGLFIALSGLLAIASCAPRSSSVKWQDGAKVLGEEALFDLLLDNVSAQTPVAQVEAALEQVEIASLGRNDEQDLWLVRFNLAAVCGRLGCLHTVVSRDSDKTVQSQLWTQYLQPDVPTGSALALVPPPNGDIEPSTFSCFETRQVSDSALVNTTQCFENGNYRVVAENQSSLL